MSFTRGLSSVIVLLAFPLATAIAQTTNGAINGTILDPSGSVLQGAQIDATQTDTGLHRTAVSSANGTYTIPQLPPGTYNISVQKAGFANQDRKGIQLLVNQNATLDFQMSLTAVSQTVEVTAATPALNTTSATLGGVSNISKLSIYP